MISTIRPKLGKKAPRHDPRTLLLEHYMRPGAIPTPPASMEWARGVGNWPMMANDQIGDCTCAAAGHMIQSWTSDAHHPTVPATPEIIAAYSAVSGYDPRSGANDEGAAELDVLKYWRLHGIAGHRISAFAALEPRNHLHVREAIWLFGGCYLGLDLPASCEDQVVWAVPQGGLRGRGAPGSWGGHAVCAIAYDSRGISVITWGAVKRMTWGFWDAYCDEAYAVLSHDWASSKALAPSGFDFEGLQRDLHAVTN